MARSATWSLSSRRPIPTAAPAPGRSWAGAGMEGGKRARNLKKMGLKAQDTSELFFTDVKVPKNNVLGEPGKGFHFLTHFLAEERLITACGAMTLCQVAFDVTLQFVKERKA